MNDVLQRICEDRKGHIAHKKASVPEASLRKQASSIEAPRGFIKAISAKIAAGQTALIAEVKKASPSKGVLRENFQPVNIAKDYSAAGACCLSVLTDVPYFQGEDSYLTKVRQNVHLPILRKDFMLDPYQVLESRAIGADCILLIMAALSPTQAQLLEQVARSLGMDVLAEVHNEAELEQALQLQTPLIGINNRDLKTLTVDLAVTETLSKLVPDTHILVSESGIKTAKDIARLKQSRVSCFLVGESLVVQKDIKVATKALLAK